MLSKEKVFTKLNIKSLEYTFPPAESFVPLTAYHKKSLITYVYKFN